VTVDVSGHVDAPAAAAWAALSRFEHWPAWGPSIRAVDPARGDVRPGATGHVRSWGGPWLPFRIDEVDPGRRWTWHVAGLPATGHRVESIGPDSCRVVFEVPVWALPYAVVCRAAIPRIARVARDLR
jgi:uncharacterized protein YndB with AHSA1/START domain